MATTPHSSLSLSNGSIPPLCIGLVPHRQLKEISYGFTQSCHHEAGILRRQLFDPAHRRLGATENALTSAFAEKIPLCRQIGRLCKIGFDTHAGMEAGLRKGARGPSI